ncbi:PucR family transcriptional regulator [Aquibacillus sediminis]|uniref:PucR family transcriptional regulator n=1 Tax=Aquibacillus sediminis TaxID=2574734 RepID=UPI001109B424|nr:helix-turn-helix domain-containing protein [Aquibacillus sediminis]
MLQNLKEVFPSLIEVTKQTTLDREKYVWFHHNDANLIGIAKQEVTPKELKVLETFLTPYHLSNIPITPREEQWVNVLYHGGDPALLGSTNHPNYRYVYFSLSDTDIDPLAFKEAIHGLFSTNVPILWENNHEGVIIEENQLQLEADISYQEIIDVLMSDFYMNVHLYISSYFHDANHALEQYQWTKKCFYATYPHSKNTVITYVDAIPYLFLSELDQPSMSLIVESILKETITEDELLDTVRIFLECNSNATFAAKKLYMHRNSLQYRVDKFIEKTGIDIKQFHGGLSVYLTLLLKQKKKHNM